MISISSRSVDEDVAATDVAVSDTDASVRAFTAVAIFCAGFSRDKILERASCTFEMEINL
jgi:hypothetical protein